MRKSYLATSVAAVGVFMLASSAMAFETLENATTRLQVFGGEASNGLVPSGGYFDYFDKARNDSTTWSVDPVLIEPTGAVHVLSNGLLSSPVLDGSAIVSNATVGDISIEARTQLIGSTARTTFSLQVIPAIGGGGGVGLSGYKFLFYTENDINGVNDDATFTGSIAGGNLRLFQFDEAGSEFFVRVNEVDRSNAQLSLFGSGRWTGFGTALEAGDLSVLSSDGSNFVTSGDIGNALLWDLGSDFTSSITVDYLTVAEIPEPTTLALLAGAGLLVLRRR